MTLRLATVLIACLVGAAAADAQPAVDANLATQAQLESLPGLGVASTERLLRARAERPFRDWHDLMSRVKGLKRASAQRLSDAGLTVNGARYAAER